ncbi:unnamed protein product [Closterium sp. NIES-54]
METNCADPRDQDIRDLTLAAQGEDRGATRVVVNNQQKVALAAVSTDTGWAPHVHVESLQGSNRRGKRGGVRSGALLPLDARKAGWGRRGREGKQRPGKTRDKEVGVHATKAWQGGVIRWWCHRRVCPIATTPTAAATATPTAVTIAATKAPTPATTPTTATTSTASTTSTATPTTTLAATATTLATLALAAATLPTSRSSPDILAPSLSTAAEEA